MEMQARFDLAARDKDLQTKVKIDFPASIDRAFARAIQEALCYVGRTSPNPPVGCVVLDQHGNILTVAAHHQAGALHAEALALQQCRDLGVWDKIHDIIVTLEPCNHRGRTPPCSESILQTPAKRIWVGVHDPNPEVCGAGNQRLQQGGKEVILLQDIDNPRAIHWVQQCHALIAPFVKSVTQHKAWITVKQALTVSGSMIPPQGQKTFTSSSSLRLAHQLRRGTEAIITGSNTIKKDWPSFTVRYVSDHPKQKRLLVVCSQQAKILQDVIPVPYIHEAQENGFSIILCNNVEQLPSLLYEHHVLWGMVEGGPYLLRAIQQKHVWDEWLTFRQQHQGEDEVKLKSNHAFLPTALLLSQTKRLKSSEKKDALCSLVS